ncbi:hypothetical protein GT347_22250 [Xylophilus rhododendri]|uniref:Uncharacterized protein n=1 Tax=Xylophilus rhododendri TaxID=2697032 RepID=A0A857JCP5_9BURK|nr:hypothetical protein [Xylophilus rhododendri]QHJ00456.1 hypothetical protein GT347_22250 [Xylophilus rhododendri]
MRNALDFSSLTGLLSTLLGLVVVSLVAVSIRLLVMTGVQQRRERQNRQINERLKTLIAAYKTLGGSFTGDLTVDPSHLRDLRARADAADAALKRAEVEAAVAPVEGAAPPAVVPARPPETGSERRRRIRDAVEAALSDVVLLGTREQVELAARAANDMVAGRPVETAELVVSLRAFIREVLDLEAMPAGLSIPRQGPLRGGSSGKGGGGQGEGKSGGGGGGGGGGAGGAGGGGGGGFAAIGVHHDPAAADHPLQPG